MSITSPSSAPDSIAQCDLSPPPNAQNDNRRRRPFLVILLPQFIREVVLPGSLQNAAEAASTFSRFFRSKHVGDLRLFFRLALLALFVHAWFVRHESAGDTVLVAALPLYAAIVAWTYLAAGTRLGVVDLFACEIRTVCRVSTVFEVAKIYIDKHAECQKMIDNGQGDQPFGEKPLALDSKGFISQEDYFPVFSNNSHDLESLEATVVGNITEFYTYMKVARDLQRKLADYATAKIAEATYVNLIYVLYLGHESARRAIKELIEFEPSRAENIMIILLTELRCFAFLCNYYPHGGLKFQRLLFRLRDYKCDLDALKRDVAERSENDPDWGPARRTLSALKERYDEVLATLDPATALTAAPAAIKDELPPPSLPGRAA